MKQRITLTETDLPHGGVNMWRPDFRQLPIEQIENICQEDFQSYASVGYNSFTFHRMTATISIRRLKTQNS